MITGFTMPNKNIMVGILLAEKALIKSPYVQRYKPWGKI
jgi:Tfp pilus assembly major pilin PilA